MRSGSEPTFVDASYNLGKTLFKIGDLQGARDAYARALAFDARYPGLRRNLAYVLGELGDLDAAIALLEQEAAEAPGDDRAPAQLARAWRERSGSEAAIAFYRSAIERFPRSPVLRYGLARLLLARGAWREGWTQYLSRDLVVRTDPPPDWETFPGELSDARIRLIGEQGLGDVLFFARFAPELKRRGAWLGLECQPKLVPLLRRSPVFDEVGPVDGRGPGRPGERRVFIGDLPAMLGAQTAPAPIPLTVDPERVARCRAMLAGQGEPPFIGLTWRAGTHPREPEFGRRLDALFKEIDLDALATAFDGVPGTLVVVQRNPRPEESSRLSRRLQRAAPDLSALNEDLEEMSALLAALDDYVGVSNTNVHLAAGVGKRARVLVPYPPEWRWMEAGDESQWFPGCKAYRQSATRSWAEALARLRADLLAIPSGRGPVR